MLRQRQYSLTQLLLVVTYVALAAVLVHYFLATGGRLLEWIGKAITGFVLVVFAAVGCGSLFHAFRQIWYWPKTRGRIMRYCIKRGQGREGGVREDGGQETEQPFYHPVVRFETIEGQPVTALSGCGWGWRPWSRGDTVSVRYNPRNPKWAEIACFTNMWAMPATFLGLAAVIGALIYWFD